MANQRKARVSAETFDHFLIEQGLLEDAERVAVKRVFVWQTKVGSDTLASHLPAFSERLSPEREEDS